MTQPLPSPTTKPAPAGSPRLDMGNFFQPAAQSGAAPDFESLFAGQNPKEQRDSTPETGANRKKKKSPIEETPLAAQPTANLDRPNLDSAPSLENLRKTSPESGNTDTAVLQSQAGLKSQEPPKKATEATPESVGHGEGSSEAAADPESLQPAHKTEANQEIQDTVSEELDAQISGQPDETNPVVDGMETAPNDPEMISLATFEQAESGAPRAAREPLVTSSNRFSISAAISERNGVAGISGSGGSAESQLGQAGTGSAQAPANLFPAASKEAPQAAASLLKTLGAELEKFRQSGESQVQLDVPVGDGESVKVRLNLRAGELRSTFITDSAELREALQKAWPDFAQTSRDRGFRFGDPSFQNAFSQNPSNPQGRQSQSDREAAAALQPTSKTPARRTVVPSAAGARTALWA